MHCVVAFTTDFIYVSVAISLKTGYRLVTEFYRRIFEPKRVGRYWRLQPENVSFSSARGLSNGPSSRGMCYGMMTSVSPSAHLICLFLRLSWIRNFELKDFETSVHISGSIFPGARV